MRRAGIALVGAILSFVGPLGSRVITDAQAQGGSSPTGGVIGRDLSGKYIFQRVECHSRSTGSLTAIATYSGLTDIIEISGNGYTDTVTGGSCTFITRGSVVFTDTGTFSSTDSKVSVPGSSCTLTANVSVLNSSGATSVPIQITYSDGQTQPGQSGQYQVDAASGTVSAEFRNPVSFPAADRCLSVYSRT